MTKRNSGGSRKEILEAIKQKLATTDMGGGGKNFWKPKQGANQIRILPGVGNMGEMFWTSVGSHYLGPRNNVMCPEVTLGDECPICKYVQQLYADAGNQESKELAGKLRARKQFWMNIVDRADEAKGVQIYAPGVTVFGSIASLVQDPDYGDIYDADDGLDITINRAGAGLDTEYEVIPRRNSTPLSASQSTTDDWMDAAYDLSPVILTDDPSEDQAKLVDEAGIPFPVAVKPYSRIEREFEQPEDTSSDSSDDEEDEEEESAVKAAIKKRRSSRSANSKRR